MNSNLPGKITRKQLAEFLPDSRVIRTIEQIIEQSIASAVTVNQFETRITTLEGNTCCDEFESFTEQFKVENNGDANVIGSGLLGYGNGTGGIVTQIGAKTAPVVLNKSNGQIVMDGSLMIASTTLSFTLNNNRINPTDVIIINISSGATVGRYTAYIDSIGNGFCIISISLSIGGNLSESVILNFAIIKSTNS